MIGFAKGKNQFNITSLKEIILFIIKNNIISLNLQYLIKSKEADERKGIDSLYYIPEIEAPLVIKFVEFSILCVEVLLHLSLSIGVVQLAQLVFTN